MEGNRWPGEYSGHTAYNYCFIIKKEPVYRCCLSASQVTFHFKARISSLKSPVKVLCKFKARISRFSSLKLPVKQYLISVVMSPQHTK